jgi:DNA-binding beta-propeller fold protein YncE
MKRDILLGEIAILLLGFSLPFVVSGAEGQKAVLPIFEVDYKFPTLPDKMLLGQVSGVAADKHGNIWVINRPHTFEPGEEAENGYKPLPPVVEWDANGKFITAWGGPSPNGEYQWPNRGGLRSDFAPCQSCTNEPRKVGGNEPGNGEHGIYVDYKDNVWVTSNGAGDGQILKFTKDGKFLLQIGHAGRSGGARYGAGAGLVDSNDTENVSGATTVAVYPKTNEVFVADGYGNRRIIVFDADTGKFKRLWGAYGNKPDDNAPKGHFLWGAPPQQFTTVHGVTISDDGVVYVADRSNNRVQAFTVDGKFLKEGFDARESKGIGSVFAVALSHDPPQRFLYIADFSNARIDIMDRESLKVIGSFGRPGRLSGQFYQVHSLATDPQGNVITGETSGYRVQKFVLKGYTGGYTGQ